MYQKVKKLFNISAGETSPKINQYWQHNHTKIVSMLHEIRTIYIVYVYIYYYGESKKYMMKNPLYVCVIS